MPGGGGLRGGEDWDVVLGGGVPKAAFHWLGTLELITNTSFQES